LSNQGNKAAKFIAIDREGKLQKIYITGLIGLYTTSLSMKRDRDARS